MPPNVGGVEKDIGFACRVTRIASQTGRHAVVKSGVAPALATRAKFDPCLRRLHRGSPSVDVEWSVRGTTPFNEDCKPISSERFAISRRRAVVVRRGTLTGAQLS